MSTEAGVGVFPVGHWHDGPDVVPMDWDRLEPGEVLPTVPWRFEPFENAILSFFSELRHPRYLTDQPATALPVVALWASFSHLASRYRLGPIIDVEHAFRFHRRLIPGESTELSGAITDKYERKGRYYIAWHTHCTGDRDDTIFDFDHTVIDLREPSS